MRDSLQHEVGNEESSCLINPARCYSACCWSGGQGSAAEEVARIGYLSPFDPASDSNGTEAIRLGLRERGYIEGQNTAIEYRYAEGKLDRLPELAAELVRLKVDVIVVAGGGKSPRAVKNATKTIPIVMAGLPNDPVETGMVESLARPGGNVTGLSSLSRELAGKRLELFKEAVPKLARVAVLYDPALRGSSREVKKDLPVAASALRLSYSTLGDTSCGRFREGFCCTKQTAAGWTIRICGPASDQ